MRVVLLICLLCLCSTLTAASSTQVDYDEQVLAAARRASELYQRHTAELRRRLETGDRAERVVAIREMGRLLDPSLVPTLLPMLDADLQAVEVVRAAAHALAHMGAVEAAPRLERLIKRDDERLRTAALNALTQLRKTADPHYQAEGDAEHHPVRATAITELGTREVAAAAETLAGALTSDDRAHIRRMAAIGLGKIRASSQAEALIKALSDRDALVRRYAAEALTIIDHKPAIPYLLIALEGGRATGDINRAIVRLSGQDFGWRRSGNVIEKQEALNRGFEWWTANADRFRDGGD